MTASTKIEWADSTFNPWIGCTKISPACDNCYAENMMDKRIHAVEWGSGKARKRTSAANWREPLKWNREAFLQCECGWRGGDRERPEKYTTGLNTQPACPRCGKTYAFTATRRRVFCASLADVFDNEVDPQWRQDLFELISATPKLDWLLLTKRIGNVGNMLPVPFDFDKHYPHVWLGATICNQDEADRDIPKLMEIPAAIRFLSIEPMLSPISLHAARLPCIRSDGAMMDPETGAYECCSECDYTGIGDEFGIDWVIVGGESGSAARSMQFEWVREIRDECTTAGVPFLFKQWGEWAPNWLNESDGTMVPGSMHMDRMGKRIAGRKLDGRTHDEFPVVQS